jgi:hypothetical protein
MRDCNVLISMNGKSGLSWDEMWEMDMAIREARNVLLEIGGNLQLNLVD